MSYEDKAKATKRNQLIMGVVLILIMVFSTVGFAFSFGISGNAIEEQEYGGVKFVRDVNSGFWVFNINGVDYYTIYNPDEVSDIKFINNKRAGNYANRPLYFIGDPGDGFGELYRTLNNFATRVGGACLNEDCEEDYPIKECDVDNIVIIETIEKSKVSKMDFEAFSSGKEDESKSPMEDVLEVGGKEEIVSDVNCVYIRAKPENLVRYVDAYLFDLLGL